MNVRTVAYYDGAFWISPYEWHDPIAVLKSGKRPGWKWIGSPGWWYDAKNEAIYNAVTEKIGDMIHWDDPAWEAVNFDIVLKDGD